MKLAEDLNDQLIEAQACYSLGNTYVLLRNHQLAIDYYLRHLSIAQKLQDRIGEGRAYWSLSNVMQTIGEHEKAIEYVQKHLEISKEIGDLTGQENAEISISKLRQKLNIESANNDRVKDIMRPKRISMNKMELINLTPIQQKKATDDNAKNKPHDYGSKSNEEFFELVSKFQSKRMDDQRCSIQILSNKENLPNKAVSFNDEPISNKKSNIRGDEAIFDLIAGMQERRMNDQRAILPSRTIHYCNSIASSTINTGNNKENHQNLKKNRTQRQYSLNTISTTLDDDFFDMLIRCQANRLEDQRSEMPSTSHSLKKLDDKTTIDRPMSVSSTQSNTPVSIF